VVVAADDFFVCGEEDDLVRGEGEIALDNVIAVGGVEATERGIDDGGDGSTGGASEAPEHGGGEELPFASGESVEGEREAAAVGEGYFEGFRVDAEAVDEVTFAEEGLEGFEHEGFHAGDMAFDDFGTEFAEGIADFGGVFEHAESGVLSEFGIDVAVAESVDAFEDFLALSGEGRFSCFEGVEVGHFGGMGRSGCDEEILVTGDGILFRDAAEF
jgi:hypothetical protein